MRSAGIIGGLVIAVAVIAAVRCAKADERKCVDISRARAEALKDKNLLRTRTLERLPMLRLQAVKPARCIMPADEFPAYTCLFPDYDAGLLVEWRDGSGILLKGFGFTLCREENLAPLRLTEHRILLGSFTKKIKRSRKPYTRQAELPAPSYARERE